MSCTEIKGDKSRLKTRSEIDDKYKWDLSGIYKNEADWKKDFDSVRKEIDEISLFKGKLHDATKLEQFLQKSVDLGIKFENVYVYAMLNFSEDTSNGHWEEMKGRVYQLESDYDIKRVFVKKELSSLSNADINGLILANPNLKSHEYFLRDYARYKPHILSENEEEIIAQLGIVLDKPSDIFSAFGNNNIIFPKIKNKKGEEIQLTHGLFSALLRDSDRDMRKLAFESYYQPYKQNIDVLANTYAANLLAEAKIAKIKKYGSSLEMHLFPDNLSVEVYMNLIDVAKESKNIISRYNQLRIKELNLDKLCYYDMYVPLARQVDKQYTFEESVALIRDSLTPLGDEYLKLYDKIFRERKVDVFESKGKRSGAFSSGTYTSGGGYVFLNYNGTLGDIFMNTHEIGHGINIALSASSQPFLYYDNPIILAEIASTFNEYILSEYLVNHAKDNEEKKYHINNYIDFIRTTFFRQAMFADFELRTHEMAEKGEPITSKTLTDTYRGILKEHLGPEMTIDENLDKEWSRIPHFYRNFYLYKYATSMSAAIALSQKVLKGGHGDAEQYLNFLKAGSHKESLEILKDSGVDMTKSDTFRATTRLFGDMIREYEAL